MKQKFKLEEDQKKAVSDALDKVIHDENDIKKIFEEIDNAENYILTDNFTDKYAFIA